MALARGCGAAENLSPEAHVEHLARPTVETIAARRALQLVKGLLALRRLKRSQESISRSWSMDESLQVKRQLLQGAEGRPQGLFLLKDPYPFRHRRGDAREVVFSVSLADPGVIVVQRVDVSAIHQLFSFLTDLIAVVVSFQSRSSHL